MQILKAVRTIRQLTLGEKYVCQCCGQSCGVASEKVTMVDHVPVPDHIASEALVTTDVSDCCLAKVDIVESFFGTGQIRRGTYHLEVDGYVDVEEYHIKAIKAIQSTDLFGESFDE